MQPRFDTESIISLILWFLCVMYSSIRTATNTQTSKLTGSDKVLLKDDGNSEYALDKLQAVVWSILSLYADEYSCGVH